MASHLEDLPEELRLHILSFLPHSDLWLSVRHVNSRYRSYAEDVACKKLIPKFTIGMNFSLSPGAHHRWYGVWGTVHHGFKEINARNPQFALFETISVDPKTCQERVLETWKRMCASGFGPEQLWRVYLYPTGLLMEVPTLVLSETGGVWCDWRELLDGYYARLPSVWEGLARPME